MEHWQFTRGHLGSAARVIGVSPASRFVDLAAISRNLRNPERRRRDAELSNRVQNRTVVRDIVSSDRSTPSATIVVAENEVLVRMVVADYLRYRGFRVVEAGTADEAIRVPGTGELAVPERIN